MTKEPRISSFNLYHTMAVQRGNVASITGSGTTAVGQLSFAEVSGISMGKAIAAAIVFG